MKWHHGHNNSIVNGIPRIGFMKGGKSAQWVDENMMDIFLEKAKEYVDNNAGNPFFLYYAMQQPHVPRTPHARFVGKSGLGPRGDVIVEADWAVGEFLKTLEQQELLENTLIILSSDNGPVLNDGYFDEATEKNGEHKPSGPYRGGKYSLFEAGTHVPFYVNWKDNIAPGVSDALVCQLDLLSSLAKMVGSDVRTSDSQELLDVFLGKSDNGRDQLVLEATSRTAFRKGEWVMIPPYDGPAINQQVNIELGNSDAYQLYNLTEDIEQQTNLAATNPEILEQMVDSFVKIRGDNFGSVKPLELK
jgi:arylsulfatase A-like enzyme